MQTITDHHAIAQRKARYGHRHWIAWVDVHGVAHSGQATVDNLTRAIVEVQGRKFSGYSPSTGQGHVLSPLVANVWLQNARRGFLR